MLRGDAGEAGTVAALVPRFTSQVSPFLLPSLKIKAYFLLQQNEGDNRVPLRVEVSSVQVHGAVILSI